MKPFIKKRELIQLVNNIQVYPICGISEKSIGLTIGGWTINAAHKIPLPNEDAIITFPLLERFLVSSGLNENIRYKYECENPFYLYFWNKTDSIFSIKPVINALRLFKCSSFGTWYPISFNDLGGGMANAFDGYAYNPPKYSGDFQIFTLSEKEVDDLTNFYTCTNKPHSLYLENMLDLFHESFRIDNENLRFVMWITILEMFIGIQTELSYRLSRGVAVFLGKTNEESLEIFETCKNLYNARSKYLHNGDEDIITTDFSMKALDYARRVIANLMVIESDIKKIRKTLDCSGFGSNPLKVEL